MVERNRGGTDARPSRRRGSTIWSTMPALRKARRRRFGSPSLLSASSRPRRAGANSTSSSVNASLCCSHSPRSRSCAGAWASPGGNGQSSCARLIRQRCVMPCQWTRMSSTTTPSCNGPPISSSRPAGPRRKMPACRSDSILMLRSASAPTASMPGAIRISFCRRSRLALRPTSSTPRVSAGASPGSIR